MLEAKVNGEQVLEVVLGTQGIQVNGQVVPADVQRLDAHTYQVLHKGASHTVHILSVDRTAKVVVLKVDGKRAEVKLSNEMDRLLRQLGLEGAASNKIIDIKAPMPGLILSILVQPGQAVTKGQGLIILEAMKMENILKAPADGTVDKVLVQQGQIVEKGAVLIVMK